MGSDRFVFTVSLATRTLHLRTPWTVSRGTSTSREAIILDLEPGLGEAPIVPYYPYTTSVVREWLERVESLRGAVNDEHPAQVLGRVPEGPPPARCALDCAVHDRWAQRLGVPLFEALGLDEARMPVTSISIGIPADDEHFAASLERVADWPLIKLKLGSGNLPRDLSLVRMARRAGTARVIVDANGAWTEDEAVRAIPSLGELGVELVEEPLRRREPEAWRRLRSRLPHDVPLLAADESVQSAEDVRALAGAADAINVKIAKAGGVLPALKLIQLAHDHDMKVLLGCMIETSLGITAAAHLAPLADFADLDGHLHLRDDPFEGVRIESGSIFLPERPGLGVRARATQSPSRG